MVYDFMPTLFQNAAAFWYNAKPSGEFDKNTQHAGCPVLLGEKWGKMFLFLIKHTQHVMIVFI